MRFQQASPGYHKEFKRYTLKQKTRDRPPSAVTGWRNTEEIKIALKGDYAAYENTPEWEESIIPLLEFDEVDMPEQMRRQLQRENYMTPTPVQSQAWPIAMSGFDIVAISETGSGKTLAFGLPAFLHCKYGPVRRQPKQPQCVILAPTRDLALQIHGDLTSFSDPSTKIALVRGGGNVQENLGLVHIVCCTIGRLTHFARDGRIALQGVTYLVLDEADHMVASFERELHEVIRYMPEKRQTLMWTATWPPAIEDAAARCTRGGWVHLNVGYNHLRPKRNVRQFVQEAKGDKQKEELLISLLRERVFNRENPLKALIFANTTNRVRSLANSLEKVGIPIVKLAAQACDQVERDRIIDEFKCRPPPAVMVATGLMQRGVHLRGLNVVVNYDMPFGIEDYAHRVGRAGRNELIGDAYTLINPAHDLKVVPDLVKAFESSKCDVPPLLTRLEQQCPPPGRDGGYTNNWGGYPQNGAPMQRNPATVHPDDWAQVAKDHWAQSAEGSAWTPSHDQAPSHSHMWRGGGQAPRDPPQVPEPQSWAWGKGVHFPDRVQAPEVHRPVPDAFGQEWGRGPIEQPQQQSNGWGQPPPPQQQQQEQQQQSNGWGQPPPQQQQQNNGWHPQQPQPQSNGWRSPTQTAASLASLWNQQPTAVQESPVQPPQQHPLADSLNDEWFRSRRPGDSSQDVLATLPGFDSGFPEKQGEEPFWPVTPVTQGPEKQQQHEEDAGQAPLPPKQEPVQKPHFPGAVKDIADLKDEVEGDDPW